MKIHYAMTNQDIDPNFWGALCDPCGNKQHFTMIKSKVTCKQCLKKLKT